MHLNDNKLCRGCGVLVQRYPWILCNKCKNYSVKTRSECSRIKYILEQKNKPCTDCGISYPSYVMDFDHLPQYEKLFAIGRTITYHKSFKALKEELAKCELVCANCHRIRTHNRAIENMDNNSI